MVNHLSYLDLAPPVCSSTFAPSAKEKNSRLLDPVLGTTQNLLLNSSF